MTPTATASATPDAWIAAAGLLTRWLEKHERVDTLLAGLPAALGRAGRARCQHLLFDAVRQLGRIEAALNPLLARPPRAKLRAALLVTGGELLDASADGAGERSGDAGAGSTEKGEGKVARIVHHAVERTKAFASPAEARLVNAVARKLAAALGAQPAPGAGATAAELAAWFSHPVWLVERWLAQFGAEKTRALLAWNQRNAPVYARWRDVGSPPPAWLKPTAWANFFEVPAGRWGEIEALLAAGQLYLQDPATRLAVELLAPQPGESVLDLCAAPGGKSLLIADAMSGAEVRGGGAPPTPELTEADKREGGVAAPVAADPNMGPTTLAEEREAGDLLAVGKRDEGGASPMKGKLVALDLPGARIDRLKENLARVSGVEVALVQADAALVDAHLFRSHALPEAYEAVLLDAPCTNTGVMRHRVDVKWRLQAGDFRKHATQQLALLHAAARLVAPGGRLVYSTCSVDAEENERVVAEFFTSRAGGAFKLEKQTVSVPWESGHDGAAAFLLRKTG